MRNFLTSSGTAIELSLQRYQTSSLHLTISQDTGMRYESESFRNFNTPFQKENENRGFMAKKE